MAAQQHRARPQLPPARDFWLSQLHIWINSGFPNQNTGSIKSLLGERGVGVHILRYLPELDTVQDQAPGRQPGLGRLSQIPKFFFTGNVLVIQGLLGRG